MDRMLQRIALLEAENVLLREGSSDGSASIQLMTMNT